MKYLFLRPLILIVPLVSAGPVLAEPEMTYRPGPEMTYRDVIHEGHIHYDFDVWEDLPPASAIEMLRAEGIVRALVSATPTEGAQMMYEQDPKLVIPMLRPYRNSRHRYLWFKDPELRSYLLEHLARAPYRGFGEFHVFGEDMDTGPIEDMIELARDRGLYLHPHTNLEGMKILLGKASDIVVLWAHGGFDVPIEALKDLMHRYPKFYVELSLREGILDEDLYITAEWRDFLTEHAERFIVGMDTYVPRRWASLPEIADETRVILSQVDASVARKIAIENMERLFPLESAASE